MKRLRSAVELEGALVGREVSCGIFAGLFAAAREEGVDLETLLEGTGFPLAHYHDPTERVSWVAVQEISRRIGLLWSQAELRAIGARSLDIQHFEPQIFLARLLLRPTEAYAFIIRGDSQGDFACLSVVTTVDGQHVDIKLTIAAGYGHAESLFWILCGAAEAAPSIFGLPHATVEMSLHERGADFSVQVPPGGGRWSWFDRIRHGLWRPRQLNAVGDRLAQRSRAVETEVAKRLTVEVELKAALAEHHRRLANLHDAVVEIDLDGSVSFASSNLTVVLGVDDAAFCADPWLFLDPPEAEPSSSWITRIEATGRWIEINPSRSTGSGLTALLLVLRDVTERVELAEQVNGASRLESLGVMAAGVAHDFNNLLVPIGTNAGSVLDDLDPDSPIRDRVMAIQRAAEMASQLTDQILVSTGQSIRSDESCDASAVVRSMEPVLVEVTPRMVDVIFDLDAAAPACVDEDSLSKLLTNLVVNAGQAVGDSGIVRVAVESTADAVVLRVSDDGCGMSPETIARMSEPFFTTRSSGRGLGLASLAGLLQQGTASVDVESVVGEGTTIAVSFKRGSVPAVTGRPEQITTTALPDLSILLVDDDELVRRTIHRVLERSFSTVQSASNAAEARQLLLGDTAIDCVIADLTMPDVRGPELVVQLRSIAPQLGAVLITGAGLDRALGELADVGLTDVAVLPKPFSPQELFAAVNGHTVAESVV